MGVSGIAGVLCRIGDLGFCPLVIKGSELPNADAAPSRLVAARNQTPQGLVKPLNMWRDVVCTAIRSEWTDVGTFRGETLS
ncbi:MAG: hypothetical protein ACFB11_23660 [Paracoccaceae bacterium]